MVELDEETIYYRKLTAFLRDLPELARYDYRLIISSRLEDALEKKFGAMAVVLSDFEAEAEDSHNTIRDWYFRCLLTVIVKLRTESAREGRVPEIITGEVDGYPSVGVVGGILSEAFRREYLGGYVNLINFRMEESNPIISGLEGLTVESRVYSVEGIREVNL